MGRPLARLALAAAVVAVALAPAGGAGAPAPAWPLTIVPPPVPLPLPLAPLASSGGLWLPAPQNGKAYSGACLHTKATFAQRYGYWEVRLRAAAGPGLHSAFWGKPASEAWPPELDVEEIGGDRPDTVIMTVHWRDGGGHRQRNQRFRGDDFSDGFHVIGTEWSPEGTVWYVGGVERARIDDGAAEMAAQGPFYALLDLQVGLGGAVQPSAATPFPAEQLVDYVRIWRRPFGSG